MKGWKSALGFSWIDRFCGLSSEKESGWPKDFSEGLPAIHLDCLLLLMRGYSNDLVNSPTMGLLISFRISASVLPCPRRNISLVKTDSTVLS